ncbi:hypothetical protein [Paraburkholderia sp. UCT2]|uniref:hypothetical protein n=1 Tax=Paraburkholderia sp. UCT2 TaxID=2615208 RepID=UPI0016563AAB|nr:hypothetical protein [Paraburkholderia sp. UCT2]MBC8728149.1 hypothetical protein [Paraburkholderia sp. UCT2]
MVIVLVFKLLVTPLLLLTASLAGRRWGDAIGGLLVGFWNGGRSVVPVRGRRQDADGGTAGRHPTFYRA